MTEENLTMVAEKPVYGNISIDELEESEYSDEQRDEFMALYEESISGIKEGQIVKGRVAAVSSSEVLVDIGFKSEVPFPSASSTIPNPSCWTRR